MTKLKDTPFKCESCKQEFPGKKSYNQKYCRACSSERNKIAALKNYRKKVSRVAKCKTCACVLDDKVRKECYDCQVKAKNQARIDSFLRDKTSKYKPSVSFKFY